MKKTTVLLLLLSCLLLFSSCDNLFDGSNLFGNKVESTIMQDDADSKEDSTHEHLPTGTPTDPSTDKSTVPETDSTSHKPIESTLADTTTSPDSDTASESCTDPTPDVPADPFAHTPVPTTLYYQYSHLTENERIAYDRMREAALIYENNVDISDLDLSQNAIIALVNCFIADNPQYFWIAPTYGYNTETIALDYTDGTCADNTGSGDADHTKIDERRIEFESAVDAIISAIDPALSDYEKELYIHDYLTHTVHYDTAAASTPTVNGVHVDSFCAYGALIGKTSVCEGYTEAFQYLCYRVGINANQVFGIGHVWNVVQIEGNWYQVDVTWDDPLNQYGTDGDGNHNYFNLTAEQMYKAHEHDTSSTLFVPECTATEYAYRETIE
ncbi:MAG: hypothetical protein IJX80_10690 [Clostridia bacterium]|nr:hypothetical protein [Clostridia bacterium]